MKASVEDKGKEKQEIDGKGESTLYHIESLPPFAKNPLVASSSSSKVELLFNPKQPSSTNANANTQSGEMILSSVR